MLYKGLLRLKLSTLASWVIIDDSSPSASTKALRSLLNNYKGMLPGLNTLLKRVMRSCWAWQGKQRRGKVIEEVGNLPGLSFQKRACEEMLSFCIIKSWENSWESWWKARVCNQLIQFHWEDLIRSFPYSPTYICISEKGWNSAYSST